MSPVKHPRDGAPRISISSWIMGGPIVTKPRRVHPRPVLVTTEPAKAPKAAEASKPNEKKEEKKAEDASKKAEEARSDEASKGSDTEKSDDEFNWTPEQDALILKLKAENISWKEIAAKTFLSKSDVQARFKELQKKGAQAPAMATMENNEDKEKDGEKADGKKADGEQKRDGGAGNGGRLKADDSWSREDCEILEMLEARYREQKWLSMQASFYNLTGRMVRADIIERKLSEVGL